MKLFLNKPIGKQKKTLDFKNTKSRETFHFNLPISIEGSWMIGLTKVEVNNSFFNKTEENKFKIFLLLESKIGSISYDKVRD